MPKIFISIFFIFFALWLPAQHLTGMVIDEQQHPLAFATVGNAKAHLGTYTDGEGKYDIEILGLSDYDTILISHIGYEEHRATIASLRSSGTPVALAPKNYSLKEVTVKPFDAKDMIRDALSHINTNYPSEWSRSQIIYKDYSQVSGHKHHYNFFDFNMYLPSYLAKDSPRLYTQVNQHQLYEERHSLFTIPLKPTDLLLLMYPEKVFSEEQLA